jgi:hypothetical protein
LRDDHGTFKSNLYASTYWTIPGNVDNEKQNKICIFSLLKIKLGKRSEAKDGINIKCFVEKPFEILRIVIFLT